MRQIDFTDGYENSSAPSQGSVQQNSLASYASTAAFVSAKGSAAANGDAFYDTTDHCGKLYINGAWQAFTYKQASDVASAGTLNLDACIGGVVDVTGTTTVTAITLAQGKQILVRFTGALTLTHGASLVLPTAGNIKTAAGDFALFVGYAAGVVRCASYHLAGTKDFFSAALTSASAATATGSFAVFTTNNLSLTFTPTKSKKYMVMVTAVFACNTAGVTNRVRINGSSGSPTVVYSQEAAWDQPGNNYYVTETLWQVVTLVAGTSYTFRTEVKNDGVATSIIYGTGAASNGSAMIAYELD